VKDIVIKHHGGTAGRPILDLPFQVCTFEMLDKPLRYFKVKDRYRLVMALLVSEVEPGIYDYFALEGTTEDLEKGNIDLGLCYMPGTWKDQDALFEYHVIVRELVDQLRASENSIGTIKQKQHIKIGYGPTRRNYKVRELVFVTPTKMKSSASTIVGHTVDWSHRWEVRGHWKKVKGIGKNREGQYIVNKLTWVVPHEKGPDGKPVIKKQRLVNDVQ